MVMNDADLMAFVESLHPQSFSPSDNVIQTPDAVEVSRPALCLSSACLSQGPPRDAGLLPGERRDRGLPSG